MENEFRFLALNHIFRKYKLNNYVGKIEDPQKLNDKLKIL